MPPVTLTYSASSSLVTASPRVVSALESPPPWPAGFGCFTVDLDGCAVCEVLGGSDSVTCVLQHRGAAWCTLTLCLPQSATSPLFLLETFAVIGAASWEWKIHPVLPTQRSGSSHVRYYFTNYLGDSDAFPSLKAKFRIVWASGIFKFWDTFCHSSKRKSPEEV